MKPFSLPYRHSLPAKTPAIFRRKWTKYPSNFSKSNLLPARSAGEISDEASGFLGEKFDELLKRKENQTLLDRLEEASIRVEKARIALSEIEKEEAETLFSKQIVLRLRNRESEIALAQKELLEARGMVDESKRRLSFDADVKSSESTQNEVMNKEAERLESIKAALISSIVGTLASLPLSMYQATILTAFVLHTTIIFIGCALFGVTFRYIIRRDIDNFQLKTGASAAFGVIKGLATLEAGEHLELNMASFVSHSIDGVFFISESIIVFLAAAIALDFCFKMRLLSPFPIEA